MSLSAEARSRLEVRQAALVSALLAGSELPVGFDAGRLRAAATALARKRARAVARTWAGLARTLGRRFSELFAAYAGTVSIPHTGGPLADGRSFARWLAARGELPEANLLQVMAVDLRYTLTPGGLIARRGLALRAVLLNRPRRVVLALRLPWLGVYWLSIPLGRRRHDALGRPD
jgi:hypothetical protein